MRSPAQTFSPMVVKEMSFCELPWLLACTYAWCLLPAWWSIYKASGSSIRIQDMPARLLLLCHRLYLDDVHFLNATLYVDSSVCLLVWEACVDVFCSIHDLGLFVPVLSANVWLMNSHCMHLPGQMICRFWTHMVSSTCIMYMCRAENGCQPVMFPDPKY